MLKISKTIFNGINDKNLKRLDRKKHIINKELLSELINSSALQNFLECLFNEEKVSLNDEQIV